MLVDIGRQTLRSVVAVAALSAVTTVPVPAQEQTTGERTIEQFICKDIMRDSGSDRDVAIAFLHGYLLGKSGRSSFDTEILRTETVAFIDRCLDNPNEKAEQAMLAVKKK
jgi:hypothetical protein